MTSAKMSEDAPTAESDDEVYFHLPDDFESEALFTLEELVEIMNRDLIGLPSNDSHNTGHGVATDNDSGDNDSVDNSESVS